MGGPTGSSLADRLLGHLNIGVAIFFLISGFLLFRPFIAHRSGGAQAPRTVVYARRRLLRIFPAYWLLLTVLVLVPGLVGVYQGHWLSQYALAQSFVVPDGGGCTAAVFECGVAQTWSLGVEMTFYIALPAYVLASSWLAARNPRRWLARELALLGALAAVSVVLLATLDPQPSWLGGTASGWVLWFALGMGLAAISVALEARSETPAAVRLIAARPALPWLAALGGYVALSLALPSSAFLLDLEKQLVVHVCFGLIAVLLLLPAVFGDQAGGLPRRFLAHPLIAWLGLISYGIFLWHYVIALELGQAGAGAGFGLVLAGTTVITIACAAVSYYVVERPLLRLKYRGARDEAGARRAPIA